MINKVFLTFFALILIGLSSSSACSELRLPLPGDRVVDPSNLLGAHHQVVVSMLQEFQQIKGSEIAVVVLPSLAEYGEGLTIEQYAIKLAEYWRLGRKGVDDGLILLVALKERELRIEVGRGLEGDIPDITARRIIEEQIKPFFRAGDYATGIEQGIRAVIAQIRKAELPPPTVPHDQNGSGGLMNTGVGLVALGVFIASFLGPLGSATAMGTFAYLVATFAFTLPQLSALGFALIVVFLVWFFAFAQGSGSGGSGYSSYGSGGYGNTRSGGSFGGFGSGGSFGGGGASGRW